MISRRKIADARKIIDDLRTKFGFLSSLFAIIDSALAAPAASASTVDGTNSPATISTIDSKSFIGKLKGQLVKAFELAKKAAGAGRRVIALREHARRHARTYWYQLTRTSVLASTPPHNADVSSFFFSTLIRWSARDR